MNIIPDASPERLAVDDLIKFRNKAYGHAVKGAISNYDYHIFKAQIEQSIMILAKAQGREAEFKQKLNDAAVRPLDETIMKQYQTMMANHEMIQTIKNIEYAVGAKSLPDCLAKDISDVTVTEGRDAHFEIWTKAEGLCAIWSKNGSEIENSKFKSSRFGIIHSLYIMNTCLLDKGLYTVTVNNIERQACLYIEEYFTMNPKSMECIEGGKVQFQCEVVEDGFPAYWIRYGKCLENAGKYEILQFGKVHRLSILQCDLDDAGDYTVNINNRVRTTSLVVKEYFTKNLEITYEYGKGDTVQLSCEVIDSNAAALWDKNGVVIEQSDKYTIIHKGTTHALYIINADLYDAGNYRIKIANRMRVTSIQVKQIPPAIGHMSEKDKRLYLEIIQSGTETRYSMRIPIIGENGAGKTSLLRRLLGDTIEDVQSTDGVDIVHRCKIRLDDGKWFVDKGTDKINDIIRRIKRAVNESKQQNRTGKARYRNDSCQTISDSSQVWGSNIFENRPIRPGTSTVNVAKTVETKLTDQLVVTESLTFKMDDKIDKNSDALDSVEDHVIQSSPLSKSNQLLTAYEKPESKLNKALSEKILHELSEFINVIDKCEVTDEVLVGCGFWDFAGEKHYYPTHPIFLNPYAVHLLVVDIMKDIQQISTEYGYDKIGEYIDFWFDSIHSCGPSDGTMNSTGDYLNPPFILVCTGIDKCKDKDEENEQPAKKFKGGQIQRFYQKCHVCGKEPPVCWCHDCQKSMCYDCHNNRSDLDDNTSHILQHVHDKYSLSSKFKVDLSLITDLKVFNDGLLVMADWNGKQLVLCHITGQEQYNIDLPGDPLRMAVVDKHTVAVTLPIISTVVIVNVRERKVLQNIEAKVDAGGIMFRDEQMFLGLGKTIKILDMSGEVKHTIPVGNVANYICGGKSECIFYTDLEKLYCIDSKGNTLFTFTDPYMRGPRVLTLDNKGNLLVTCERSNNLFRISPDGKESHVIIKQIPMSSWSPYMCYDPVSESVFIGLDKTVYVYTKL